MCGCYLFAWKPIAMKTSKFPEVSQPWSPGTFIHGCSSGTLSVVIPCETAPMVGAGAAVHPALPWILRVMLGALLTIWGCGVPWWVPLAMWWCPLGCPCIISIPRQNGVNTLLDTSKIHSEYAHAVCVFCLWISVCFCETAVHSANLPMHLWRIIHVKTYMYIYICVCLYAYI